jgi:hypothetical protein
MTEHLGSRIYQLPDSYAYAKSVTRRTTISEMSLSLSHPWSSTEEWPIFVMGD